MPVGGLQLSTNSTREALIKPLRKLQKKRQLTKTLNRSFRRFELMTASRSMFVVASSLALFAGCASEPVRELKRLFQSKGDPELATGIRNYEDGSYAEASRNLQSALQSGVSNSNQVKAHKYLAFIHCASGREKQCRDEFGRALAIDPSMELEPAEVGHPTWGPVFRSVKSRR